MRLKFNNNKRQRIIKGNPREKLFNSTNWNTDGNKTPDLLDFFVTSGISSTYTDLQSSYDLTSVHSPIMATLRTSVIVRKTTPRLHNSKTNWDTHRQITENRVNLSIKLKEHEGIKLETDNLLNLLRHAAKGATSKSDPQRTTNNTPYEIKRLVVEKRRARSFFKELTYQTSEEYITEQATNLNPNSKKCGMNSLKNTFLPFKRKITLFGNLQKNRRKPKTSHPIRKYSTPPRQ